MWTLLYLMACTDPIGPQLSPAGVAAKSELAQALETRDPPTVSTKAETAAQWEGQDPALDRMLGDALANVLMHPTDGLRLLHANPSPDDPDWTKAVLLGTLRGGDVEAMKTAWTAAGRAVPAFDNPITLAMIQRAHADPTLALSRIEAGINGCALLDAQPPIGRTALDYPAAPALLEVARWLGADATVVGRPKAATDADPQQGRGPLQCERKVLLDAWPVPLTKTLTLGLSMGQRKVFIDIKINDGEPWVFATSDALAGGRWIQALSLHDTPNAEQRIRALYPDGLWAQPETP
jgi:hypothetical protein